jgi:hypothetical protein
MYWICQCETMTKKTEDAGRGDGRFVVHRHRDDQGPHLDVRLEQDGYLMGWRVDGTALADGAWATEKAPHPLAWLDNDGDAVREDEGEYCWLERSAERRSVLLRGRTGDRVLFFERAIALPGHVLRGVADALDATGADGGDAGRLIRDGVVARERALARFCGLGRELDGDAFDDVVWRRALESLSLEEIHVQLRAYEARFDMKYPPQPVSRPERLPEENAAEREAESLAILQG